MNFELSYSTEVADARKSGLPIVALESTIITHGMPYPRNLETAQQVEEIVRQNGAIPATIAVINGVIKIGLEAIELSDLSQTSDVLKLSRADIAQCIVQRRTGATTVAATMILSSLAGIDVFATGGIGGVHRGAELSFDVSADLQELAGSPVTVVSAGAKAILDIAKTLETLETLGVPVIGYQTDVFPAFWSRVSAFDLVLRMDTAQEIAQAHAMKTKLKLSGGQLVANPVPQNNEIPPQEIEPIIECAVQQANERGISGKALTPFLLGAIVEATGGASLDTNIALVKNNAKLAAEIAVALSKITQL
jgi:pseudouridine-5'-phosphate glycosidase